MFYFFVGFRRATQLASSRFIFPPRVATRAASTQKKRNVVHTNKCIAYHIYIGSFSPYSQARNATGMLPLHLSASGGDARCVDTNPCS